MYGIDMEQTQRPKLLSEIPPIDIVITMGCNVECPILPCKHREDWGLDDAAGKNDVVFRATIQQIQDKVGGLRTRFEQKEISFS